MRCPSNKNVYMSRQAAWLKAVHYYLWLGTPQYAYKCTYCKKFHLTSLGREMPEYAWNKLENYLGFKIPEE